MRALNSALIIVGGCFFRNKDTSKGTEHTCTADAWAPLTLAFAQATQAATPCTPPLLCPTSHTAPACPLHRNQGTNSQFAFTGLYTPTQTDNPDKRPTTELLPAAPEAVLYRKSTAAALTTLPNPYPTRGPCLTQVQHLPCSAEHPAQPSPLQATCPAGNLSCRQLNNCAESRPWYECGCFTTGVVPHTMQCNLQPFNLSWDPRTIKAGRIGHPSSHTVQLWAYNRWE